MESLRNTRARGEVEILREQLALSGPKLRVATVDSFQGQEKEVVLLSLVRSNARSAPPPEPFVSPQEADTQSGRF